MEDKILFTETQINQAKLLNCKKIEKGSSNRALFLFLQT